MQFLGIALSVGKQFLNNKKHVSLVTEVQSVISKEVTKNPSNVELNVPESLKGSLKK
ncbi:MAG TPA: hypothetical protein PLS50_07935 [Candidatus Dojkabacteria bacterium]|nr:hypothetical protein [Candidatus Dojkabacteria bacterium]